MSPRKWLKALFAILVPFVVMYALGKPIFESYLIAHPRRLQWDLEASEIGRPVERVRFSASDGIELVGWFVPGSGEGAAIAVSHGSHANGPGTYPGVAFLNEAGYHVLVFDHRAHGQSGGRVTTLGPLEVLDLRGAVAYLQSRPDTDPERIGAMGCSMGSVVVIGAAAQDAAIKAVVAESVYADLGELWTRFGYVGIQGTSLHWSWGPVMRWATRLWTGCPVARFKPEALIGDISPRPVLIIHGDQDNAATTVADARRLYKAAREPKELWIVEGGGHCSSHALFREAYETRVLGFLDQALRRQGGR
jgi:alpha-beta hydrolase superfamily lysophospholipase